MNDLSHDQRGEYERRIAELEALVAGQAAEIVRLNDEVEARDRAQIEWMRDWGSVHAKLDELSAAVDRVEAMVYELPGNVD